MVIGEPQGALRQFANREGVPVDAALAIIVAELFLFMADHAAAALESDPEPVRRVDEQAPHRSAGHGGILVVPRELPGLPGIQSLACSANPNTSGAILPHGVPRGVLETHQLKDPLGIANQSFLHPD